VHVIFEKQAKERSHNNQMKVFLVMQIELDFVGKHDSSKRRRVSDKPLCIESYLIISWTYT
jgi:hypothetical protein